MEAVKKFEQQYQKSKLPDIRSGDTVRVHQRITEGSKQRTQVFEGVVIRSRNLGSLAAAVTVRRIASGVGVEKTFKLHAPNIEKVVVIKRAKVRRNYLSFLRQRQGKSARLREIGLDEVVEEAVANAEQTDTAEVAAEQPQEQPEDAGTDTEPETENSTDKDSAAT